MTPTTTVQQFPVTGNLSASFKLVYLVELDSDMALAFHSLALFNGDMLIGACTFNVESIPTRMFIESTGSTTVRFMRYDIDRPVSYLTVDVTEAAQEAVARAVSSWPILYFGRYDGSVKVRRMDTDGDAVMVDLDPYEDLSPSRAEVISHQDILTRVRVSGALPENEASNTALASKYLLRFDVFQNPEVISQEAALVEAQRIMRSNIRQSRPISLSWHMLPVLEPYDVVTIDGVRHIFSNATYDVGLGMQGTATFLQESHES